MIYSKFLSQLWLKFLQVQISKSKSKSKNVGRDNYVLRVRFDNWAPVIDQREKWVELLVQGALSQVCHANFVCRFSRNYGQIWPNSQKSHYRPQKNIKFLTEKSPLQKTFSKNRELVKIWNDQQIARWDPNPHLSKLHMSLHCNQLCECGDTSCVINLIWTASCNSFDYLSVHEWRQVLDLDNGLFIFYEIMFLFLLIFHM